MCFRDTKEMGCTRQTGISIPQCRRSGGHLPRSSAVHSRNFQTEPLQAAITDRHAESRPFICRGGRNNAVCCNQTSILYLGNRTRLEIGPPGAEKCDFWGFVRCCLPCCFQSLGARGDLV